MVENEKIPVYIKYENYHTVCICKQERKMCNCTDCEKDIVERNRYNGLADLFLQNRFGKSTFIR